MPEPTQNRWVEGMAEAYERGLVPAVFGPFAVDLARRVAAGAPRRVLELAAGTGAVTRHLVAALGDGVVTATDLNDAMVELGRRQVPGASWRQADALRLPFGDAEFDVVACQFGAMFFPDKPAAFAESRRVLVPGGRLLFSTWGPLRAHDFEVAFTAGLERAFPDDPPTFLERVPHGYADAATVAADVEAGGLEEVRVETLTVEGHAPSAADLAIAYCTGTPVRAEIEARGDLAATTALVTEVMEERLGPGPVTGRMTAHVVEARRPLGAESGA